MTKTGLHDVLLKGRKSLLGGELTIDDIEPAEPATLSASRPKGRIPLPESGDFVRRPPVFELEP